MAACSPRGTLCCCSGSRWCAYCVSRSGRSLVCCSRSRRAGREAGDRPGSAAGWRDGSNHPKTKIAALSRHVSACSAWAIQELTRADRSRIAFCDRVGLPRLGPDRALDHLAPAGSAGAASPSRSPLSIRLFTAARRPMQSSSCKPLQAAALAQDLSASRLRSKTAGGGRLKGSGSGRRFAHHRRVPVRATGGRSDGRPRSAREPVRGRAFLARPRIDDRGSGAPRWQGGRRATTMAAPRARAAVTCRSRSHRRRDVATVEMPDRRARRGAKS